jgi:hypothetical protein
MDSALEITLPTQEITTVNTVRRNRWFTPEMNRLRAAKPSKIADEKISKNSYEVLATFLSNT